MKPFTLTNEHSPVEMRIWLKVFTAFFSANELDKSEISVQQSYLLKFVLVNIRQRIEGDITEHTAVLDEGDGCLGLLIRDFEVRYSVFNRRLDYFAVKEMADQSALSFAKKS